MAIVEMKHVDMLALDADKPVLLREIQKLGCIQLLPSDSSDASFNRIGGEKELPVLEETVNRVLWAIGKLNRFDKTKKALMADKPSIDETQAQQVLDRKAELMAVVENLEALERESGELRGQTARVDAAREQLQPWINLPVPLNELRATHYTLTVLGTAPKAGAASWISDNTLGELCEITQISQERDQAYLYLLMYRTCAERVMQTLKDGGFAAITLPQLPATVRQQLTELEAQRAEIEEKQKDITARTAAQVSEILALQQLYDILNAKRVRLIAAQNFSASQHTFFLQGWVPDMMVDKVEKRLRKVSPTVALEFYDAAQGEEPPVLLHNAAVVEPFESVVAGYSLPATGSIDPTAIMMPFFVNFMGMMISDAGYGLMMAIIMPLLIKFLKPAPGTKRMLWILTAGGVATVFWGAMYNSWFGFAPLPSLFDPMNNALPVMGVCIGLGAIHLFTGLGVAAYMNIKRGKWKDAIADQLSWFLLVVGLVMMIVLPAVGKWLAMAGAGIILVTAGRAKSKNPFKRLLSGLGALYGATSWISDLLSYMRLFGMGLATGVIGMVINILVAMVFSAGPIGWVLGAVLFVGGHLFNAGINTLGAYVHSCRLQYIEFFGKFYEDGGKPFVPLAQNNRFVYITDAQAHS